MFKEKYTKKIEVKLTIAKHKNVLKAPIEVSKK